MSRFGTPRKNFWGILGVTTVYLVLIDQGTLHGNFLDEQPVYWMGKLARKTAIGEFEMYRKNVILVYRMGTPYVNSGCAGGGIDRVNYGNTQDVPEKD